MFCRGNLYMTFYCRTKESRKSKYLPNCGGGGGTGGWFATWTLCCTFLMLHCGAVDPMVGQAEEGTHTGLMALQADTQLWD